MTAMSKKSRYPHIIDGDGAPDNELLRDLNKTPCPLCGSSVAALISETPYADIWSNLHAEWGVTISDSVKAAHTLAPVAEMRACSDCGLWYFSPAIPGSSQFYSEITSSCPHYYTDHKWEFDYVKGLLKDTHKVLDVACGKGAFLRLISGVVDVAVGIDTYPDAVLFGSEVGQAIYNRSVDEFAADHCDAFDVVTAFQVVEHLGAVMPFVAAAYRCVKPGGILVLSVPNRDRRKDLSFGSLDYPPHHLSRWREDQLGMVADQLDARIVSIAKEPLNKSQTIGALRTKELQHFLPVNFLGRAFIIKVVSRLALSFPLSLIWSKLRLAEHLGMYGMSMVATIQKPITVCQGLTSSSQFAVTQDNSCRQ
ncbi:MAG: class I SAM-dependent methyltransferase [Rhodocyclales bacterium]|nr:class I SAM-dependent methyltransferase [Rhodocyclales bacterium]